MKSTFIISLIALVLLSVSCKKPEVETPALSLKGKWTEENMVVKIYDNNALIFNYDAPVIGTTLDFQSNGMAVVTYPASTESFPYTITSDSKVEFDGDTYEIKNLTATRVTLYIRDETAPGEYAELYRNLKR